MEQTSSLTAESDWSAGSRVTISLVSPIWSRKETPWMDPREFVRLEAVWPPLERRLQRVAGGLGDGDGVGGATWWAGAKKCGDSGGGLLSADIGCYLWRCPGSRKVSNGKDVKKVPSGWFRQGWWVLRAHLPQVSHGWKVSLTEASQRPKLTKRAFLKEKPEFRFSKVNPLRNTAGLLTVYQLHLLTVEEKHIQALLTNVVHLKQTKRITLEVCSPYCGNTKV